MTLPLSTATATTTTTSSYPDSHYQYHHHNRLRHHLTDRTAIFLRRPIGQSTALARESLTTRWIYYTYHARFHLLIPTYDCCLLYYYYYSFSYRPPRGPGTTGSALPLSRGCALLPTGFRHTVPVEREREREEKRTRDGSEEIGLTDRPHINFFRARRRSIRCSFSFRGTRFREHSQREREERRGDSGCAEREAYEVLL